MTTSPIKQLFIITGNSRGIGKALLSEVLNRTGSFAVSLSIEKDSFEEKHFIAKHWV